MSRGAGARIRNSSYRTILRTRGQTVHNLEVLRWLEGQPSATVSAFQEAQLRRLLSHAAERVPFYRAALSQSGVVSSTGDVHLDWFSQVPLLEKPQLYDHFTDLQSLGVDRRSWYENTSGGSTGETARFIQDSKFADWGRAAGLLFDSWAGYLPGDRKFLVWPVHRDVSGRRTSIRSFLVSLLRNETWLDARRMTPAAIRKSLRWIDRKRPVQVYGFPENLYELARLALDERIRPRPPKAIATSGGILLPAVRESLGDAFRAPIFDRYGSRELSGIAAECDAHSGLHICPAMQFVEILRPDGSNVDPGESGEVVVTSLVNFAMPLIRYRVGDLATWAGQSCACGREWPLLGELVGRNRDLFVKRDGTRVRILERVFHGYTWVRKFQAIQEDYDHVRILIVPGGLPEQLGEVPANGLEQIREAIRGAMGEDCRVEVILTDRIDTTPSGKFRQQISKVP